MSPVRPVTLLVTASLMAGCAVGPDYQRPALALPDRYLSQPAAGQTPATAPARLVNWWESFNDPVLTGFVTQALEQNLDLA